MWLSRPYLSTADLRIWRHERGYPQDIAYAPPSLHGPGPVPTRRGSDRTAIEIGKPPLKAVGHGRVGNARAMQRDRDRRRIDRAAFPAVHFPRHQRLIA